MSETLWLSTHQAGAGPGCKRWRRRVDARVPWRGRAGCAVTLIVALCSGLLGPSAVAGPVAGVAPARPNIVFVLTDDLSDNLVTSQFMLELTALSHQGTAFANYFVTDSLCCPSRASIFTGRYPHDTGVFDNSGSDGGYTAFNGHGDEKSTLATDLQAAGYRTAMMGKYLNKYQVSDPPAQGWSTWDVAGWGYPEFNYDINENGKSVHYGGPSVPGKDNYLTDVLSSLADGFVRQTVQDDPGQPFFLEVATFAPHSPFTPTPRYADLYPDLKYPETPAFDAAAINPPSWLGHRRPLTTNQLALDTEDFRLRAQDVKSVDNLIGNLMATLKATGTLDGQAEPTRSAPSTRRRRAVPDRRR